MPGNDKGPPINSILIVGPPGCGEGVFPKGMLKQPAVGAGSVGSGQVACIIKFNALSPQKVKKVSCQQFVQPRQTAEKRTEKKPPFHICRKTTLLRDMARLLSNDLQQEVIVVDTSSEIAGIIFLTRELQKDRSSKSTIVRMRCLCSQSPLACAFVLASLARHVCKLPHMPVAGQECYHLKQALEGTQRFPGPNNLQYKACNNQYVAPVYQIRNHGPEVIIVDEIGTEQEVAAATTISQRGVNMIGTAHGYSLHSLLQNPVLVKLVGGLQVIT
eukprot:1154572-Pelagomonas_calceolata.AAC.3